LIYPSHLKDRRVAWPIKNFRKWNAICDDETTAKMLLPAGWYVLVKRFSVKEESRRIVAAVFEPADAQGGRVGFENHLNVIHCDSAGIDEALARGLSAWLNSTVLDDYYRQISGHTQVNATDLRNLPFPTATQLLELGKAVEGGLLDQHKLDSLVGLHVFGNR
jgi:adenine-specific DNA-methyltransferase